MLERLVESWLDSQGERQYQPAFVQALISSGWKVLHNSRHSPIEYGRDIIARDPNGVLHALQLKGNPGTRLTKSQAQDILPQLRELIIVPLGATYYRTKTEKAVAVLVTNGTVDEEAEREIDLLRDLLNGTRTSRFEIWSRGELLDLFARNSRSVWPTTITGVRSILELHSASGLGIPDFSLIDAVCEDSLQSAIKGNSKTAKSAAINQLAVLIEIMKGPWRAKNNHWSCYLIGVIGYTYALQLVQNAIKANQKHLEFSETIWDDATSLIEECIEFDYDPKKVWFQKDPFEEFSFMGQRRHEIATLAATLLLSKRVISPELRSAAINCVEENFRSFELWGEAQIPGLMVQYMCLSNVQGCDWIDLRLAGLIVEISRRQLVETGKVNLPNYYYSFEDVFFYLANENALAEKRINRDSFYGQSWTSLTLLYLLSKRNRKRSCRLLWRELSKLTQEDLSGLGDHFFSTRLVYEGHQQSRTLFSMTWQQLVSEACYPADPCDITGFNAHAPLLAAYVAAVPHRAGRDVMLTLDSWLCDTWWTFEKQPPS